DHPSEVAFGGPDLGDHIVRALLDQRDGHFLGLRHDFLHQERDDVLDDLAFGLGHSSSEPASSAASASVSSTVGSSEAAGRSSAGTASSSEGTSISSGAAAGA